MGLVGVRKALLDLGRVGSEGCRVLEASFGVQFMRNFQLGTAVDEMPAECQLLKRLRLKKASGERPRTGPLILLEQVSKNDRILPVSSIDTGIQRLVVGVSGPTLLDGGGPGLAIKLHTAARGCQLVAERCEDGKLIPAPDEWRNPLPVS